MRIRQLLALLALAAATGIQAQSASPPSTPPLTLAQVMAAARDNVEVALARSNVDAARADIRAADHAPLPLLSAKAASIDLQNGVGGGNLLRDKRIDKSLGIDWTWERGDKRALRTLAAQRTADAVAADFDDTRLQQQLAALGAYFDLLAAQERIGELEAIERSAAQLAATAQRRVKAGDLAAQDANRSEIEARRVRLDVDTAQLDRERAALALASLIGSAAPNVLRVAALWPATAARADVPDFGALIDRRSDVRAVEARVQAAQAAREGALALKRSDITWGTSFDHFPGSSTRQLELRLQMPLQWGYEQQGEIARAEAQLAQARDAAVRARLLAANELQRLQREAQALAARAQAHADDIVPRARRAAEQAELAYSKGALPLTDLLDARRTLRSTLLDALAARTDHAKADGAWRLRTQDDAPVRPQ